MLSWLQKGAVFQAQLLAGNMAPLLCEAISVIAVLAWLVSSAKSFVKEAGEDLPALPPSQSGMQKCILFKGLLSLHVWADYCNALCDSLLNYPIALSVQPELMSLYEF